MYLLIIPILSTLVGANDKHGRAEQRKKIDKINISQFCQSVIKLLIKLISYFHCPSSTFLKLSSFYYYFFGLPAISIETKELAESSSSMTLFCSLWSEFPFSFISSSSSLSWVFFQKTPYLQISSLQSSSSFPMVVDMLLIIFLTFTSEELTAILVLAIKLFKAFFALSELKSTTIDNRIDYISESIIFLFLLTSYRTLYISIFRSASPVSMRLSSSSISNYFLPFHLQTFIQSAPSSLSYQFLRQRRNLNPKIFICLSNDFKLRLQTQ